MGTDYFVGSDGLRRAYHLHDQGKRAIIVGCHGLFSWKGDERGKQSLLARRCREHAISLFRFDCLGCGESDGEFSDSTLDRRIRDCGEAVEFVRSHFFPTDIPLFLLGSSFGGPVVLSTAASTSGKVAGIVTWSAPIDLVGLYRQRYGLFYHRWQSGRSVCIEQDGRQFLLTPRFPVALEEFDINTLADRLKDVPLLVLHGELDETVPVEQAGILTDAWSGPVRKIIIHGGRHRLEEHIEEVLDMTVTFLEDTIATL